MGPVEAEGQHLPMLSPHVLDTEAISRRVWLSERESSFTVPILPSPIEVIDVRDLACAWEPHEEEDLF